MLKIIFAVLTATQLMANNVDCNDYQIISSLQSIIHELKVCDPESSDYEEHCFGNLGQQKSPFLLKKNEPNRKMVIAWHGLSDGPYMYKDIAKDLYDLGYDVIVPRTSGQFGDDYNRLGCVTRNDWRQDFSEVLNHVREMYQQDIVLAGFSLGAALISDYIGNSSSEEIQDIKGMLFFSPFIRWSDNVEGRHDLLTNLASDYRLIQRLAFTKDPFEPVADPEIGYPFGGSTFRYTNSPWGALQEAMHLVSEIPHHIQHNQNFRNIPLFMAMSEDDHVIGRTQILITTQALSRHNDNLRVLYFNRTFPEKLLGNYLESVHFNENQSIPHESIMLESTADAEIGLVNPQYDDMMESLSNFIRTL